MPPPGVTPTTDSSPESRREGATEPSNRLAKHWLMQKLGITGPQAKQLIRAFLADRADEAREASREEFSAWFNRRGDLLIVRGKIKHGWAVTS